MRTTKYVAAKELIETIDYKDIDGLETKNPLTETRLYLTSKYGKDYTSRYTYTFDFNTYVANIYLVTYSYEEVSNV